MGNQSKRQNLMSNINNAKKLKKKEECDLANDRLGNALIILLYIYYFYSLLTIL